MYHIAICDDEETFIHELEKQISRFAQERDIEIKITAYSDGGSLLENYPPDIDLIFLDIKMARIDGLKAAESIRKTDLKVSIIFLTSMAQYALKGYKYQATNFIIKPIKYVRLRDELERWLESRRQKEKEFIVVSNDTGKYKVFLDKLQYIETFGRNLMLHTDCENIVSYQTMKDFETKLPSSAFVRCHTSYLIGLLYVKHVEKLEIFLTNGRIIPISQPKRKLVMERLAEYWGEKL